MAGIYIHTPFCRSRCTYCGFYSTTRLELRQSYVEAVCKEMLSRADTVCQEGELIETVYLGGGTPSQLSVTQLQQLFSTLHQTFPVAAHAEVTMECNPEDVTDELAAALPALGINRVSMGAQTFSDQRLQFLHRRHSAAQVSKAVQRLRRVGISNISIDLMYGFPEETLDNWQHDIDAALDLNVEHLSAYALSYEEGTPLYRQLQQGRFCETDEELERNMYYLLIDRLTEAGYMHYELSNFAKPGFRSRHNTGYWTYRPYIGLGAAAHSFDGNRRSWNPDNLLLYIEGISNGTLQPAFEDLDPDTRYNDQIVTALRTREGLSLSKLSAGHRTHLLKSARPYLSDGLVTIDDDRLHLTRSGLFVSDMIMSDLMLV
jgi:oxygen-independent coproporphyrinogen-3 oxidase